MAIYNVHAGHCPQGKGASGAVGILKESVENRLVKDEVIRLLRAEGHTVYDCICEENTTQNGCLQKIVSKCNQHSVNLDVSIHLNSGRNDYSGDGSTGGTEVFNYDTRTKAISDRICANISTALGIRNRGTKYTKSLYVLNNTKSLAVLVECCFVDDKDDADRWDYKKCAKAIAEGILGKSVSESLNTGNTSAVSPASGGSSSGSFLVKVLCDLNIRKGPGVSYAKAGCITDKGTYTIVETKDVNGVPWGRLKSGAGWISIHSKYVKRV